MPGWAHPGWAPGHMYIYMHAGVGLWSYIHIYTHIYIHACMPGWPHIYMRLYMSVLR